MTKINLSIGLLSIVLSASVALAVTSGPVRKPAQQKQTKVQEPPPPEIENDAIGADTADISADDKAYETPAEETPEEPVEVVEERQEQTPQQKMEDAKPRPESPKRQVSDAAPKITVTPTFGRGSDRPVLKKKLKNGTKIYATKASPQKEAAHVHLGPMNLSGLQNGSTGISYSDIYGTASPFAVYADYEYQFFQKIGKLALKAGAGFFSAQGSGKFLIDDSARGRPIFSEQPLLLISVPVNIGAVYRMQFFDGQIIVPFGEGGIDYFGMFEYRNDKALLQDGVTVGGAPAFHWAAGLQIQLDFLDRQGLWQLDNEYGINHIYLSGDIRQFIGLGTSFNFTSTIFEGGVVVEF